jgi:hypothetical protein
LYAFTTPYCTGRRRDETKSSFFGNSKKVQTMLNGYLPTPVIVENEKIAGYIVPPSLGNRSGVLGAIALAKVLTQ